MGAQAAKARLLHTEPAAGAVGLTWLLRRLQQQPGHAALHLRHINPHVASIFQVLPSVVRRDGQLRCSRARAASTAPAARHCKCCMAPSHGGDALDRA